MQLHQILAGASPHDAITDHALQLRAWLQALGYASHIYAGHIETGFQTDIQPLENYRDRGEPYLIYHHSLGSDVVDKILGLGKPLFLIYHNVTPSRFFATIDPAKAAASRQGLAQLDQLREQTVLAAGVSHVNRQVLDDCGFSETAVLPLAFDVDAYRHPVNPVIQEAYADAPLFLFVGRLAPNKRQEDLLKLLYAYHQIDPRAKLALVGNLWSKSYVNWIDDIAQQLGVRHAVVLPGLVSQADLVTYYQTADLYISMSEQIGRAHV